ncbi:MAG: Arginine--tRNA ligase [Actinomycetia bacterium]|nr:Arginine--tRNA ligase [Actinomycetes bacterium]
MISTDLRRAISRAVAAAGFAAAGDPGLRPTGTPGQYAASVALTLGANPRETAAALAARLQAARWIARAEVTGPGYLTVTVTTETLAAVADTITAAGPACVTSDALAGVTVTAAPPADPLAAPTWEKARTALAARLTARLAAAAGATVTDFVAAERNRLTLPPHPSSLDPLGLGVSRTRSEDSRAEPDAKPQPHVTEVAAAVAFAGRDAVTFTLARAIPGKPLRIDPQTIARRVLGNPAYAVRYAHARAASGLRWAATSSAADTIGVAEAAALLDALSWLPERVASAARRGRPDEFARYLEDLASVTVDILSSASHPGKGGPLGNGPKSGTSLAGHGGVSQLTLAMAARTGLAAGLGLLEVSAPERLLATDTYKGSQT